MVDLDDLLDQRCLRDEARVGVHQAGGVGQQDEQVGTEELGDERCDAVVVAEADLVVGQGVVLVDDRDHAELEQAFDRRPRVEVLRPDHEVERCQQDLTGDHAEPAEVLAPGLHEPGLSDRGDGLERPGVAGSLAGGNAQRRQTGRHRTGGHQDHLVALTPGAEHLLGRLGDPDPVDHPVLVGETRRPELRDDPHVNRLTGRSDGEPGRRRTAGRPSRRRRRTRTRTRRCARRRPIGPPPGPAHDRPRGGPAAPGRRRTPRDWSGPRGRRPAGHPGRGPRTTRRRSA